jgi:hypothetical protein
MPSVTPIDINTTKPRTLTNNDQERRISMKKQRFVNKILLLMVIIAIGFGGYFYYKLHKLQNNSAEASKEAKDLLGKVAKLYLIPLEEEPTIATVSDPEALKGQSFFTSSVKGDKVLIFTKAGKAVLYRPSINKIIETAPINNKNEQATKAPEPQTTSSKDAKDKTF